jgi:hypothetical protein
MCFLQSVSIIEGSKGISGIDEFTEVTRRLEKRSGCSCRSSPYLKLRRCPILNCERCSSFSLDTHGSPPVKTCEVDGGSILKGAGYRFAHLPVAPAVCMEGSPLWFDAPFEVGCQHPWGVRRG